jgi:uncharacterized cupredoxin-like copper-binding protein
LPVDGLPEEDNAVDETSDELEVLGRTEDLDAGDSETVSATLDPGSYVLICNVVGHYGLGMQLGFEVTAP